VRAIYELDRVCRNWILTTPLDGMKVRSHKRHLTDEDLDFFSRKTGAMWRKYSRWYFMWKGKISPEFKDAKKYERKPGLVGRYYTR
ncbi:MAG: hypothetical protein WBF37_00825, partial [Dehalococcoidia bacterium]